MTTEDLDGSGWDLAKALKLLAKSNAPLIEWLFPPVTYRSNDAFLLQMQAFAKDCFRPSLHYTITWEPPRTLWKYAKPNR
jgi:predicted nucleotidyltransferase